MIIYTDIDEVEHITVPNVDSKTILQHFAVKNLRRKRSLHSFMYWDEMGVTIPPDAYPTFLIKQET